MDRRNFFRLGAAAALATATATATSSSRFDSDLIGTQSQLLGLTRARTLFVDQAGADSNSGLAATSPIATLAKVGSALRDGDHVLLKRGGRWNEELIITRSQVYVGCYGEGLQPVIDRGIGARQANGITIDSATDVVLDGMEVCNCAEYAVKLRNAQRCIVRGCRLHDCDRNAVQALIGGGSHMVE